MPRFYCVKQFSPGDGVAVIHKVTIPTWADPGFYRSIGSLNAFFHGRGDRNNFWALHPKTAKANGFKAGKPKHKFWYYGIPWEEFEADKTTGAFLGSRMYQNVPVEEHASIWDFYKHIGFDYKTQKWSKHLITGNLKPDKIPY